MKKSLLTLKITLFQFLIFFSFSALGQCNIDALFVEITACEGNDFDVSINFEYENTSDQFIVTGNGNNYGTYNYGDLPITLTTLEADCSTNFEFVVTDANNNNCSDFVEWGLVCCEEQCVLSDLELSTSECDGNDFQVTFDFNYEWNYSPTFDWEIVGVSSGTAFFADLPLTVTVFDSQNSGLGFVVTETGNPNCDLETSFENPCIEPSCFIGVVFAEITDCVDGEFDAIIDFQYSNTSDEFTIAGNGMNYGTFSYANLPITIDGLAGDCSTEYEFVITDVNDNDCSNFNELGTVCCGGDCELNDLILDSSGCNGETTVISIDFDYVNAPGGYFTWNILEAGLSGTEFLVNLPVSVPVSGTTDAFYTVYIEILDDPACSIDGVMENPCFDPGDCFIGELDIDVSECTGDEFFVMINFDYENTSDEFFVNTNGNNYGPYFYTSLPITIQGLESNCDVPYEFQVYDSEQNGTCESDANIGVVCCEECNITSIDFGENPVCEDGFIVTEWFIFSENTSEVGFDIYINGVFNSFLDYNGNGPYDIEIEAPDTYYFAIQACDNDNPDCCYVFELMNPCYDDECEFLDLIIETSECEDGAFDVTFDFDYSGNTNSFFDWEIPGFSNGVAAFTDLPLTVLIENTNMNGFDLFINENDNANCAIEGSFENPCFGQECFIGELDVGVSECDGNFFLVQINFEYANTSDQFIVNGNGNSYGTFLYSELPITIDGLESDCNIQYEFVVHDVNNNDCTSAVGIGEICCDEDCEMTTLDFGENPECVDGLIVTEWLIAGNNTSEVGYDIFINDVFEVFVEYNDTDWYDFDIEDPGTEYFTLKACDNDNADCCIVWEYMNPCFEGEECFIGELDIDVSDCENNEFFVTINFEYENTSDQFFVNTNGNNYGPYMYSNLPVIIQGLESNCDMPYEFQVYDSEFNGTCTSDANIGIVCCDDEECDFFDLVIETTECENGYFEVTFDFEYTGTTNDFFIWEIPVIGSGNAQFSELPVTLGLEITDINGFDLIIYEDGNDDCSIDGSFENPCYNGEECFIGELDVEVSECNGNFFHVVINFEYENISDQFFVNTAGENYGPFSYTDLPITIEELESNCDIPYEIQVYDSEQNGTCESETNIGIVCCDDEECFISELNVEVSECDGNFYFVVINFEYENTSDQFTVNGNGNSYGTFSYSDLPITIDGLESNCNLDVEFVVHDVDNNDCTSDAGIGIICCDEEACEIVSIDFGANPICVEGFIVTEWLILGENTSEVGYDIFINNEFYIFVDYNDSDWYDFDIENPGTEYFTIMACDNDNADCCSTWEVMNPCFEETECDLFELDFDVSECDGEFFLVEVDFEFSGNTNEWFDWEIPGITGGMDQFSNLPITIEIQNTTESQFTFFANENDNPNCSIVGTFGNPCYDSEDCFIDDVTAEVVLCEDDLFDVEINFEYDNVGSQFSVAGNGVDYGTFEYDDLPIIITGLSADCQLEYEFIVTDNESEDCSDFVEIGTICCEDFNQISGVQAGIFVEGEIFNITFDITNTTLKGCNIDVFIEGELYESIPSTESSFSIGPYNCDEEGIIEIKLINSCSGAEINLMFDLSDVECVTDVEDILDSIDLKWSMMQKILSLEGQTPVSLNVQLINAQGALILAENNVNIGWSKDISNYPSGLYFVRIIDANSSNKKGLLRKIVIY